MAASGPRCLARSASRIGTLRSYAAISDRRITERIVRAHSASNVLKILQKHSEQLNFIHIAAALVTMAKHSDCQSWAVQQSSTLRLLVQSLQMVLLQKDPWTTASCIWALARMPLPDAELWLSSFGREVGAMLEDLSPQGLSNILLSTALLGDGAPDELRELLPRLLRRACSLAPRSNLQDLCNNAVAAALLAEKLLPPSRRS